MPSSSACRVKTWTCGSAASARAREHRLGNAGLIDLVAPQEFIERGSVVGNCGQGLGPRASSEDGAAARVVAALAPPIFALQFGARGR